jgi:SH3 domain protein
MRVAAICLLLVAFEATAAESAQTAELNVVYVTDELRLGLYGTEETSGRALKTLISGSRLEILERSLMSIRIRTEDGDEGWVKTAYVVPSEPARRRLAALEELQADTAAALAERETEVQGLGQRIDELDLALAQAEQDTADLPGIRAENESLKASLSERGVTVPIVWFSIAVAISLALGTAIGHWWLGRKVRRQFGGVKVY